jgi:predicted dehydrogenase
MWLLDFPDVHTVSGAARSYFGPNGQKVWGLARWIADPTAVFDVDDGAIGFIRLDGGITMNLQATWAENRGPQEDIIRLELQGTEGTAILNVVNYTKLDTLRFYCEMAGAPVSVTPVVRWNGLWGHDGLLADVIASLRAGTPAPTDGEQGLIAVRVLEAMYHSAQSGREVVFERAVDALA